MLKNYFTVALRNLNRNRTYTLINALGLGLGIGCTILIFIFVKFHLGFDTFHPDKDRTYRVYTEFHEDKIRSNTGAPYPLAKVFQNDYAVADQVGLVANMPKKLITVSNDKKFEEDVSFAQPAFLEILNISLLQGNKQAVLNTPNTAIITPKMGRKLFGTDNPVGKTFKIDNSLTFTVAGLFQDIPSNTDFRSEIYLSFDNLKELAPGMVEENWWFSVAKGLQCFVLLKPGVSATTVESKVLSGISSKFYDERSAKVFRFKMQPLSDIHFNPELRGVIEKKNLWALSFIGLFLMITSCVNFINLATAQALGRAREVGVRKVLGSYRWQLFWQFIAETSVIVICAAILALTLTFVALPIVNNLFETQIAIDLFRDFNLMVFTSLLLIVVIFLSGSYPGLILAGFQPVQALKGKLFQRHVGGVTLRNGLVIAQFAISQLLIIGTIVIADQMRYSKQADLGFEKDAIVMLPIPDNRKSVVSTLRSELSQITGIENVTFCNVAPASTLLPTTSITYGSRTEAEKFSVTLKAGDDRYVPTFGLKIMEGRNLFAADTVREYLLNETAVKKLGVSSVKEVIGQNAVINGRKGTIVGVVKDFHNQSFHAAIDPIYITTLSDNYMNCSVKINTASLRPTLAAIEKRWSKVYPNHIYKYNFLNEEIGQFYKMDNMILRLIQAFAAVAILIGCMGLYGLASFTASQKTKEVGVRKVLGASVQSILFLFGREFLRLLIIAFVIAAPLAWYVMNSWLENFVYRIQIGPGIFILAIATTMLVALLAVGYRSVRAALMNPVKSLKSE